MKTNASSPPAACSQGLAWCVALALGASSSLPAVAQAIDARALSPSSMRGPGRKVASPGSAFPGSLMSQVAALEPESIVFTDVSTVIDAGNLGGPAFLGTYRSDDARSTQKFKVAHVEFRATRGVRLRYSDGSDLREQATGATLPTQWETSVLGTGAVNSRAFTALGEYSGFEPTPDGRAGTTTVDWDASPSSILKGIQARVAVTRSGMQDHAGAYKTTLTLSWYKF